MDFESYVKKDATDMAQLIRSKEVSAEELLTCSFKQLEKVNPKLNAVVHDRKDKALLEAKKNTHQDGPFSGIPMLLKDISQSLKGERITRSEEHTSELQSRGHLVCRLLLEKKK